MGISHVQNCVCCPLSSYCGCIFPITLPLGCRRHQQDLPFLFLRLKKSSQHLFLSHVVQPLTMSVVICWTHSSTSMSFLYWDSLQGVSQMWSQVPERGEESLSWSCWLHACTHSPVCRQGYSENLEDTLRRHYEGVFISSSLPYHNLK